MNEVDRLIEEVERMNAYVMAQEGSSPCMRLEEFVEMLKNVRIRLFGPKEGGS